MKHVKIIIPAVSKEFLMHLYSEMSCLLNLRKKCDMQNVIMVIYPLLFSDSFPIDNFAALITTIQCAWKAFFKCPKFEPFVCFVS